MPSRIDPTHPATGVAVSKAEARANWTAAKDEIEDLQGRIEILEETPPGSASDANAVNFVPGGAGAVTRTVRSKLRETISIADYGAVGDGVTDNTAAIQAAIDRASSSSAPSAVWIPAGIFRTGQLNLYESITIHGDGHRSALRSKPGEHLFRWRDEGEPNFLTFRHFFDIRDLRIEMDCSVDIRSSSGLFSIGGERIGVCAFLFPRNSVTGATGVESHRTRFSNMMVLAVNGGGNGSCFLFDQRMVYGLVLDHVYIQALSYGYMASFPRLRAIQPSDVNTSTNTITLSNHGHPNGRKLAFSWRADVDGIGGIAARRRWYETTEVTTNTFKLLDQDGNPVNFTSAPSDEIVVGRAREHAPEWAFDECLISKYASFTRDTAAVFCNAYKCFFDQFTHYVAEVGRGPRFLGWPSAHRDTGYDVTIANLYTEPSQVARPPGDHFQFEWHNCRVDGLEVWEQNAVARIIGSGNRFRGVSLSKGGELVIEGNKNEIEFSMAMGGPERVTDDGYHNRVLINAHGDGSKAGSAPFQVHRQSLVPVERGGWSPGFLRITPSTPYLNESALFAHGPAFHGAAAGFTNFNRRREAGLAPQGYVRISASNTQLPSLYGWCGSNKAELRWRVGDIVPRTRGLLYVRARASSSFTVEVRLMAGDHTGAVATPLALTTGWQTFEIPYNLAGTPTDTERFVTVEFPNPGRPWGVDVDLHWVALVPHPERAIGSALWLRDGVTAPASSISGIAQMYIDQADGNVKIRFANGTVKTVVLT